jgi:hypothetical protein
MALYNIETKHKYGFIDAERTRARRVEVKLRPWLPSPKLAVFALVVWALVIPLATIRTPHSNPPETGRGAEGKSNELIARVEPSSLTEDSTKRDGPASTERSQTERKRTGSNQGSTGSLGRKQEAESPAQTVDQAQLGEEAGKAILASNKGFYPLPEKSPLSGKACFDMTLCPLRIEPPTAPAPAPEIADNNRVHGKVWEDDPLSLPAQKQDAMCSGDEKSC